MLRTLLNSKITQKEPNQRPQPFQCITCLKESRSLKMMIPHFWTHNSSSATICDSCTRVTHQHVWTLFIDIFGQTGCPACNKGTEIKDLTCNCLKCQRMIMLQSHQMNTPHPNHQPCPKCGIIFQKGIALAEHLSSAHNYTVYWGKGTVNDMV